MNDFVTGLTVGFVAVGFSALMIWAVWAEGSAQHNVGFNHNVCMRVDNAGDMQCISGPKLIEILRNKR